LQGLYSGPDWVLSIGQSETILIVVLTFVTLVLIAWGLVKKSDRAWAASFYLVCSAPTSNRFCVIGIGQAKTAYVNVLLQLGRNEEAIDFVLKAEKDPNSGMAIIKFILARAYINAGHYDEVLQWLEKCRELYGPGGDFRNCAVGRGKA